MGSLNTHRDNDSMLNEEFERRRKDEFLRSWVAYGLFFLTFGIAIYATSC